MFFDSEGPRIYSDPKDSPVGEPSCRCTTNWKGQQLDDDTVDPHSRVAEVKELIEARNDDRQEQPKDPRTKG